MSEPKTIDFLKEQPELPVLEGELMPLSETQDEEPGTALLVMEPLIKNAVTIFGKEKGLDPFIEKIKERVASTDLDISTERGRKNIGSLARQIGSAKMDIKEIAQGLTEGWRKQTKAVTTETTRMEKELDALRDQVKAPLVEWKEKNDRRIAQHETDILEIGNTTTGSWADLSMEELKERRESLKKYEGKDWEEFVQRGTDALKSAITILDEGIAKKEVWLKEQAELEASRRREQERKDAHTNAIAEVRAIGETEWSTSTVESLQDRLKDLSHYESRNWEEFQNDATVAIVASRDNINASIVSRKKYDDDQAELERRRKEDIENKRKSVHKNALAELKTMAAFIGEPSVLQIEERKNLVENAKTREWEEFKAEADAAIEEASKALDETLSATTERIARTAKAAIDAVVNIETAQINEINSLAIFEKEPTLLEVSAKVDRLVELRKTVWKQLVKEGPEAVEKTTIALQTALDAAKKRADTDHQRVINNEAAAAMLAIISKDGGNVEAEVELSKAIIRAIIEKKVPYVRITY